MATTARNTKYRVIQDVMSFQVLTGTEFNEGDLMYWDTGTNSAKPLAATSGALYLLGEAQVTKPVTHTNSTWADTHANIYVGPHTVKLIARDAVAFVFGTKCYYSTDAQSFVLTSGSGMVPLGVMAVNPAENGGVGSGTTAIGSEYEVLLRTSWVFGATAV